MSHVVILGGGFGGLAAAHELRQLLPDGDEITLVDRSDVFYMGFAKLWDLSGVRPLAGGSVALGNLSARGVRYLRADVTAIHPAACRVETSVETLEADALLVALGAGPHPNHRALLDHGRAHDLYDGNALPAIHEALDAIESGRIVISILGGPFKCPPAPYEAALIVDERLRARGVRDAVEVAVTTPQPITLPVAGPDASQYVAEHLAEVGIEVFAQHKVTGVDADAQIVHFEGAGDQRYDLLLGVPATAPPAVIAESPLAGDDGFVHPDRHTLRTGFERVYAVGDCTTIPNSIGALPKAGVFAAGEGIVAARNIAADLGHGDGDTFDGHGYCFLELPGRKVAFVEGDFYAEPRPAVVLTEADDEQFLRKQAYERERLDLWLG